MRRRRAWGQAGRAIPVGIACAVLVHAAGCTLPDFLSGRSPTPLPPPTPAVDQSGGLTVTAVPAYRLIVSPGLADLPSRLLVLQVRMTTTGDAALSVAPDDLTLTLPGGRPARIFDRARAMELVRRTTLGDASLSSLSGNGAANPGGIATDTQSQVADTVMGNLLADGVFIRGQNLQGFVIADTSTPLTSLDGASLGVTAYRLRDGVAVQTAYQFVTAPQPTQTP
jgi:hypothetical protein